MIKNHPKIGLLTKYLICERNGKS